MDYFESKSSKWSIFDDDELEKRQENVWNQFGFTLPNGRLDGLIENKKNGNLMSQQLINYSLSSNQVKSKYFGHLDKSTNKDINLPSTLKSYFQSAKNQPSFLSKSNNKSILTGNKFLEPSSNYDLVKIKQEKENRDQKVSDELMDKIVARIQSKRDEIGFDSSKYLSSQKRVSTLGSSSAINKPSKKIKSEPNEPYNSLLSNLHKNSSKLGSQSKNLFQPTQDKQEPETNEIEKPSKSKVSDILAKFSFNPNPETVLSNFSLKIKSEPETNSIDLFQPSTSKCLSKLESNSRINIESDSKQQSINEAAKNFEENSYEHDEASEFQSKSSIKRDQFQLGIFTDDIDWNEDIEESMEQKDNLYDCLNKFPTTSRCIDDDENNDTESYDQPTYASYQKADDILNGGDLFDFDDRDDNLFIKSETDNKSSYFVETNFDSSALGDIKPIVFFKPEAADQNLPVERIPVCRLPKKYQSIFSGFERFNLAQSKVFEDAFATNKTLVVSAPTGSGKTAMFELAITRLIYLSDILETQYTFKIVYMAPLKTLCHERFMDWNQKFSPFCVRCVEITGDSDEKHYEQLSSASLIFTTPEKWDALLRTKGFNEIIKAIRLVLIDEVHLLNEKFRGPKLEAVITRFKVLQKRDADESLNYRFIAVSATVPNTDDLAQWLGNEKSGAICYNLDDRYRAVKLTKKVIGYPCQESVNDFLFVQNLNYKLPSLIKENSKGRPTLIFVCTRKDSQTTAEFLARESIYCKPDQRYTLSNLARDVSDSKLKNILPKGVGFHHAGLNYKDRHQIEAHFLNGNIPVLVATSTLAMGVNFPAHLVIVKGTGHYVNGSFVEYGESEILQMMGRAGRPQFDDHGVAIIMTKNKNELKYKRLISGEKVIESSIHQNLAEFFMAEIERREIQSITQAMDWIRSTFFYIRVHKNKQYYCLDPNWAPDRVEQKIRDICIKELNGLKKYGLIEMNQDGDVKPTEVGKMMAIRSISFDSMCRFLELGGTETLKDLLVVLSRCKDLNQDVNLRNNEKKHLNLLNVRSKTENNRVIRFPFSGRIKTKEMKISVLLQAHLGCIPIPKDSGLAQEVGNLLRVAQRASRCLVDIAFLKATNLSFLVNCVVLSKCLRAGIWENSKYVSKQITGVGNEFSNRLVESGITSFADILSADPRMLEMFCRRKPPFGDETIRQARRFPQYEVNIIRAQKTSRVGFPQAITIKVCLINWEIVKAAPTINQHSCVLLIGDQKNKILVKQRIADVVLVKEKGKIEKTIPVPQSATALTIHYISEYHVGIDVSLEYFPKYLLANEREKVVKIPTINNSDQLFKTSPPTETKKTKRTQRQSKQSSATVSHNTESKQNSVIINQSPRYNQIDVPQLFEEDDSIMFVPSTSNFSVDPDYAMFMEDELIDVDSASQQS